MAKEKTKKAAKAEDFKGKSADELNAMLLDLRKNQMNQRFQRAGGTLENTSEMRKTRRNIARVKTFLSQADQASGKNAEKKTTKKTAFKAAKKTA